jgi:ubiquinone/menaquinone biosynthesis C-methylase UbiE
MRPLFLDGAGKKRWDGAACEASIVVSNLEDFNRIFSRFVDQSLLIYCMLNCQAKSKEARMDAKATYRLFSQFYDVYTQGFHLDIPLYRAFLQHRKTVIEIGCGTGRVLKEIVDQDHWVTGVDISPEMLEIARGKLRNEIESGHVRLMEHDFSNKPMAETYEIALITWYTFNYILSDPLTFLGNVVSVLKDNACLVMDLFLPDAVQNPNTDGLWKERKMQFRGKEALLRDQRSFRNGIETRIQILESDEQAHTVKTLRKYYTKQEVQDLLERAGFENVRFIDGYDVKTIHPLQPEEMTRESFICVADKRPSKFG